MSKRERAADAVDRGPSPAKSGKRPKRDAPTPEVVAAPPAPPSAPTPPEIPDLPFIAEPLRPFALPLDGLNLDPKNRRKHNAKNLAAIRASLAEFGQRQLIVVQREGMIVRVGNGRVTAARELGWSHIACLLVDEKDVRAAAFAIADNRTGELGEWDEEGLALTLQDLPDALRAATGFDNGDLAELLDNLAPKGTKIRAADIPGIKFKVIIECKDEQEQAAVLERMEAEGYTCQLLMS